jgi:hypothetical protein
VKTKIKDHLKRSKIRFAKKRSKIQKEKNSSHFLFPIIPLSFPFFPSFFLTYFTFPLFSPPYLLDHTSPLAPRARNLPIVASSLLVSPLPCPPYGIVAPCCAAVSLLLPSSVPRLRLSPSCLAPTSPSTASSPWRGKSDQGHVLSPHDRVGAKRSYYFWLSLPGVPRASLAKRSTKGRLVAAYTKCSL